MTCSHENGWVCHLCAPDLWHPPQEYVDSVNRRLYQNLVEKLVPWNKAYREGNPEVEDYYFDSIETSVKQAYPDHPFFKMVGHDDSKVEEILAYIPEGKRNPIL